MDMSDEKKFTLESHFCDHPAIADDCHAWCGLENDRTLRLRRRARPHGPQDQAGTQEGPDAGKAAAD
jgi:hypothetical protein